MIEFYVPISTLGINDAEVFGSVKLWKYIVQCWGTVMWAFDGMI